MGARMKLQPWSWVDGLLIIFVLVCVYVVGSSLASALF